MKALRWLLLIPAAAICAPLVLFAVVVLATLPPMVAAGSLIALALFGVWLFVRFGRPRDSAHGSEFFLARSSVSKEGLL